VRQVVATKPSRRRDDGARPRRSVVDGFPPSSDYTSPNQFPDGFQSCPASRQQERRAEVNATLLDVLARLDDFTSSAF